MKTIKLKIVLQGNKAIDVTTKTDGNITSDDMRSMVLGGVRHLMMMHEKKCAKGSWWGNMDGL